MDTQKVIIVGGGAAGLSAALYLARAGLAPLVFAGSPPGGQLMLTSDVENFPGQESILGGQLITQMRKQAIKFGAIMKDENVLTLDIKGKNKTVNGVKTQSVILATGARALWLGLDCEKRFRGKGVSACATCDGFFFRNKEVAVVGGGDSALEEALTLTKFASKVYIVHRRAEFKASKIMQKRVLEHEKIEVIWNAEVKDIKGEKKVEGLTLNVKGTEKTLVVDGVFIAIGHKPETELFKGQVELDKKGYIITSSRYGIELLKAQNKPLEVEEKMYDPHFQTMTSESGVFAAGDCVDFVYRQASTAAGTGVQSALDAERWLEKNET